MLENHPLDLHFSNKDGVAAAVLELVKRGGTSMLNVKETVSSRSALHVAALCDNSAFIEAACSQGANVDQVAASVFHSAMLVYISKSLLSAGFSLMVASACCRREWLPRSRQRVDQMWCRRGSHYMRERCRSAFV